MSRFHKLMSAVALLACMAAGSAQAGDGLVCKDRVAATAIADSEPQAQKLAWATWQGKVAQVHGSRWTTSADAAFEAYSCSTSLEGVSLCVMVARPCASQAIADAR